RALQDYDEALRLDPKLAAALLKRGQLHQQQARHSAALADLREALELGADPGTVHFQLALVHRALKDRTAAIAHVRQALHTDPGRPEALNLQRLLESER